MALHCPDVAARLAGRRADRCCGVDGAGPVRSVAGVGARLDPHGEAVGIDGGGARPPPPSRWWSSRRRGARASHPVGARRRSGRARAGRCRGRVGDPRRRRLGTRDGTARVGGRRRLRMVRAGRRLCHHRGARRASMAPGDEPARRWPRTDGPPGRGRPGGGYRHTGGVGPARIASTRSPSSISEHSTTTGPSACTASTSRSIAASWCSSSAGSARASPACSRRWPDSPTRPVHWRGTASSRRHRDASCARAASPTSRRSRGCCPAPSPTTSASITSGSVAGPFEHARLARDIDDAGGPESVVGHRGVRLSGGQVQRLALARALATDSELLVADDVSSALDATTEVELWDTMRASGRTVIGSTTKRAALARADRVVVLVDGTVAGARPVVAALD